MCVEVVFIHSFILDSPAPSTVPGRYMTFRMSVNEGRERERKKGKRHKGRAGSNNSCVLVIQNQSINSKTTQAHFLEITQENFKTQLFTQN